MSDMKKRAKTSKYYTHVERFHDSTAYLIIAPGGATTFVRRDGSRHASKISWRGTANSLVKNGDWIVISPAKARALVTRKK